MPAENAKTNSADPDQTASSEASLVWVCIVCYSDKHFVNFGSDSQHLFTEQKEKSSKFSNVYRSRLFFAPLCGQKLKAAFF